MKRLGVETLADLLLYFPSRYDDFSAHKQIADLILGETATIEGTVQRVTQGRTARRHVHLLEAVMEDESGRIKATWFNQPFLARNIKEGAAVRLSGKVAQGSKGIYLQNPAYERAAADETHTGALIPVYPETEGITSRWLRFLIKHFLPLRQQIADPLPPQTRERHDLPPVADAIRAMHFPKSRDEAARAEHRFIFQDLLLFHLRSLRERSRLLQATSNPIPADIGLIKEFTSSLPFSLTNAQRRSVWEIAQDMARTHPMHRLLEGDVGSGKTVVAGIAALLTVRAGYRVAFMAPTEILARQHYDTLQKALMPFNIAIALKIGGEKSRKSLSASWLSSDIIVGTHALIQKGMRFEKLGLVVVDEQHRFGVNQRAALAAHADRVRPHFLSMTATPIPRTLALTIYGDLDLSLLDEMPKSRKPIVTRVIPPQERPATYRFIRAEAQKGRQAFVVCPCIEPDDKIKTKSPRSKTYQQQLLLTDVKTVTEEFKKLSEDIFPDLRIAMLHGKMKPKEKVQIMEKFRARKYDILVSTSVIEVGVDVPNAAIMVIESAERFGLAQIHQFRGRVGRGETQSYCFLFATEEGMGASRLRAVAAAKNGFELAEQDLRLRGPGSMLGTEQSGIGDLVLKGITNPVLVRAVRIEAVTLVKQSPDLSRFPALQQELRDMERSLHME